jgi:hypothetical protein
MEKNHAPAQAVIVAMEALEMINPDKAGQARSAFLRLCTQMMEEETGNQPIRQKVPAL